MKKINEKLIVFLIMGLFVNNHQVNSVPVMLVIGIIQFAWSALETLDAAHNTYAKFTTPSTVDLIERSAVLSASVEKWGGRIDRKIDQTVTTLLTHLPLMGQVTGDIRLLNVYIGRIDELYSDMRYYQRSPEKFSDRALKELVKAIISRDGDDLQGSIAQMYSLIVPQGMGKMKKSLFVLLAEETRANEMSLCGVGTSPQRRLIDLFDIAMESEMRAFAMMGFGYMMGGYLTNMTLREAMKLAVEKLVMRAQNYTQVLKDTMATSATSFRRCDPLHHQRGVTFLEFEKFLQASVLSEKVIAGWACRGCDFSKRSVYDPKHGCQGIGCNNKDFDTCLGRLTNCDTMKSKAAVCYASEGQSRRYEWFADGELNIFGNNKQGCKREVTTALKVKDCDICRCICVEDTWKSTADHYISLREQVTDIDNNMVAVGVSFVILNGILHLRVLEGKLEPRGEIVENSTSWVEPEDIHYDMEKSRKIRRPSFLKKSEGSADVELKEDRDIATLTWENRRIGLDAVTLPKDHLLTGVRFRQSGNSIRLEIRGTRADDKKGLVDPASSIWVTPDDMTVAKRKKIRDEYQHRGFKNPTESGPTTIDSSPFMGIDFHWSDLETDAGQTTVPLLDSMPVISDPPSPLIGAGLYHKAERGYGGFLTIVLEGIDKSPYLRDD